MTGIPPVIIIGMHRSGTSLVTRLLEELGFFPGWLKDFNHEAVFFQELNDWLLAQAGAAWDHPKPFRLLLEDPDIRPLALDVLARMLRTPRAIRFLGVPGYLRYRTPFRLSRPWGWKDPRNTFTMPLWRALFPEARVVHVYRHGAAVALSLKVRRTKVLDATKSSRLRPPAFSSKPLQSMRLIDSIRCASLEGGLSLWEAYMAEARGQIEGLGSAAMEVRYEDLLTEPKRWLGNLCDFCALPATRDQIDRAVVTVCKDRADTFLQDAGARALVESAARRLANFGY